MGSFRCSHDYRAAQLAGAFPARWHRHSNIVYPARNPFRSRSWLLKIRRAQVFPDQRASGMASFWSGNSAIRPWPRAGPRRAARLRGYGAFWLKAFSQETIDLTLRTHTGLQTRIVESPGLSLSQQDLDATGRGFAHHRRQDPAGRQPHLRHLLRRARTAVARHRHADPRRSHRPPDRLQRAVGDVRRTRRRAARGHPSRPRHGRS